MADGPVRKPDEETGLAITGMKPVFLPDKRRELAEQARRKKNELME